MAVLKHVRSACAPEFRMACKQCPYMPRALDLGNDLDSEETGLLHNSLHIRRRVILSRIDRHQFGMRWNPQPPALVVRQVPVEDVDVVQRQGLQQAEDVAYGEEVACAVQHHATVAVAWPVLYDALINRPLPEKRHLPKRGKAVEQSTFVMAVEHTA